MDLIGYINRTKFMLNKYVRRPGPGKARRMLRDVPAGLRRVVFGSHWSNHPGWVVFSEEDQDITKRLVFPDNSVDVVFTEHVIEHVPFLSAIDFFQEAHRILRSGGTIRTVCPIFEQLLGADFENADPMLTTYFENSMEKAKYRDMDERLKAMGLPGLKQNRRLFFLNNLFTEHGHRFIWSAELMKNTFEAIGFSDVRIGKVGEGQDPKLCIERKRRGIYLGRNWQEDEMGQPWFDPESRTIEGRKK